ncbi:hypothetical protein PAT3040_03505 [Paenibacillus agaridevorans]|uniref:Uncharacterized protein n=1 Tax=Paenibacillus agaridevorans TaxID=171404 RepID=A0A2R5EQD3_9BACL|nr:hypothetical protein PAT3040_03505 [Paenibacillus agaridevorans]
MLDEATSALDTENESNIQEAIDRLKGSMTIIVIAHRLTTLRGADRVYVLQGGRIVEEGDFANLAADRDSYLGKSFDKMSSAHVSSF